jgi:hypothetical protein
MNRISDGFAGREQDLVRRKGVAKPSDILGVYRFHAGAAFDGVDLPECGPVRSVCDGQRWVRTEAFGDGGKVGID